MFADFVVKPVLGSSVYEGFEAERVCQLLMTW